MIKLSNIQYRFLLSSDRLIDFMLDNKYTTLVNDYGFGIEYDLFEIEDNFAHIMLVLKKVGRFA